RTRLRWLGLAAVIALCDAWIVSTEGALPERVVTKWTNGRATNVMTRDQWIFSALTLTTLTGMLVGAALVLSLHRWPRMLHRSLSELSEPVRHAVMSRVERACFAMAAFVALWMTWFHELILRANAVTPPRLEAWPITLWVGAELLAALVFAVYLHRTVT